MLARGCDVTMGDPFAPQFPWWILIPVLIYPSIARPKIVGIATHIPKYSTLPSDPSQASLTLTILTHKHTNIQTYILTTRSLDSMRFTAASLLSLGLVAVHGHPLAHAEPSGCRVDLVPTLSHPQNAASNILYNSLSKWVKTTETSYISSNYLDTRNTTKAPFSVMFKSNMIPDFPSTDKIGGVLDKWVGTYLIGGETAKEDDFAITGVACS